MKKSSLILGSFMGLVVTVTAVSAAMANKPFTDVPSTHWAYEAIEAGRNTGLWEGYADGTFGLNEEITRAEVAVAMHRNNQMSASMMDFVKANSIKIDALEARIQELEAMNDEKEEEITSEQMGYIEKVYVKDGKKYIDFDYVQWLSWNVPADKEQIINDAEKNKPGACDIEADCMPPNGMRIKNEKIELKTFEITDAKISILNEDVTGNVDTTYDEFEAIFSEVNNVHQGYPYTIEYNGNMVSSIKEVYSPV